jgi:integrase
LHFELDFILIPKTKNGDPVAVPMTKIVRETLLKVLRDRRMRSDYVFTDETGKPFRPHQVSTAFKRACKRAGVEDLRFHDLRHHFASSLIQSGVDLYRVKKLLGNKDQRMTQRYDHLVQKDLKDAVSVLDKEKALQFGYNRGNEKGPRMS